MKVSHWIKKIIQRIKWHFYVWKSEVRLIQTLKPKELPGVQPLFKPVHLPDMVFNVPSPLMERLPGNGVRKYDLREVLPIAESLVTSRKGMATRILFGYHIEEIGFESPLSLDTLQNEHPLFLGHDPFAWLPDHIQDFKEKYKIYLVSFLEPKMTWQTKTHDNFTNGFRPIYSDKPGEEDVVDSYELLSFKPFFEIGHHMFSVGENDKGELAETMLLNPRDYVFSIVDVTDETIASFEQINSIVEKSKEEEKMPEKKVVNVVISSNIPHIGKTFVSKILFDALQRSGISNVEVFNHEMLPYQFVRDSQDAELTAKQAERIIESETVFIIREDFGQDKLSMILKELEVKTPEEAIQVIRKLQGVENV